MAFFERGLGEKGEGLRRAVLACLNAVLAGNSEWRLQVGPAIRSTGACDVAPH